MSQFMRSMCKIAIPVTLQSMLQSSFSIVDQLMIGQLGETNIAAVGICGNYSMLVSVLFSAVGAVAGILIAQFLGAEDRREAWSSFTVSMVLCGMIAILFAIGTVVFLKAVSMNKQNATKNMSESDWLKAMNIPLEEAEL